MGIPELQTAALFQSITALKEVLTIRNIQTDGSNRSCGCKGNAAAQTWQTEDETKDAGKPYFWNDQDKKSS